MWAVPLSHYHHNQAATLPVHAREEPAALCRGRSLPQPKPGPAPRPVSRPVAGAPQYHSNNGSVRHGGFGHSRTLGPPPLGRQAPPPPTLDEHWIGRCPELSGVICILRDGSLLQHASRHPHRRPGLSDAVATCRGAGRYCVEDAVASTQVQLNQR